MPTINQRIRDCKKSTNKEKRKKNQKNNRPQISGVCKGVGKSNPKKPNSANRSTASVKLSNGEIVTVHIPGEGHNCNEYSSV